MLDLFGAPVASPTARLDYADRVGMRPLVHVVGGLDARLADPAHLARLVIAASAFSARAFARDVLGRHPRTVQRWCNGSVLPPYAEQWLRRIERIDRRADGGLLIVLGPRTIHPFEQRHEP